MACGEFQLFAKTEAPGSGNSQVTEKPEAG